MSKRMLIDAMHPEETRVVVIDGNRLEEFDYEASSRRQLKGNIYLAKVIRVEPSLQAAFVDYGGNRHGFLPFGEIHPDYYQLPIADRQALIAEQAREDDGEDDSGPETAGPTDETDNHDAEAAETGADESGVDESGAAESGDDSAGDDDGPPEGPEEIGGDELDEVVATGHRSPRRYKIQEVIKRRQVLLVQVVKEERGTKGAALTTYLSLAGRYCVLMPNANRGGGISRKISNAADRKRVRAIMSDLDLPEGVGVILRTAAMERSKAEVKRDYDYLLRLWESIREATLEAHAPALIHEEANLIKRSIRDLYSRDTDEILVEGDTGYRTAKDFMRMLIPSHAKRVQPYKETGTPLFQRYQVENQLDAIHGDRVELKSGGYLIINPTEALVAIDVNSGRSTRERNVENTAYRTNLEAAAEVPRQLRLRDLAGLIVIDFIDMEDGRNIRNVERKLKDALRHDRARIQVGRISAFGLLELSRQRLRLSLIEASMEVCPHCKGMGHVRSIESTALHVLRAIEEEGQRRRNAEIAVHVPTQVALYVLNQKRDALAEIEGRHGLRAFLQGDDGLVPPDYRIERIKAATGDAPSAAVDAVEEAATEEPRGKRRRRRKDTSDAAAEPAEETAAETAAEGDSESGEASGRKRRRGRRGGRRRKRSESAAGETPETATESGESGGEETATEDAAPADTDRAPSSETAPAEPEDTEDAPAEAVPDTGEDETDAPKAKGKRARGGRSRRSRKAPAEDTAETAPAPESSSEEPAGPDAAPAIEEPFEAEPLAAAEPVPAQSEEYPAMDEPADAPALAAAEPEAPAAPSAPKRKGWWRRVTE